MIEECPVCGLEMSYYVDKLDGHILMEEHQSCPSGHYSCAYVTGVTSIIVGGFSIGWNYNASFEYITRAGKVVDKLVERLKRRIR